MIFVLFIKNKAKAALPVVGSAIVSVKKNPLVSASQEYLRVIVTGSISSFISM